MRYSELVKTYNTINDPTQYIDIKEGDFLALKVVDKSKEFDGCMFFEIMVFRRKTRQCYCLWCRTDELEIRVPVSYRIFEDGIPYIYVEQDCDLTQQKTVRLH